MKRSSCYSTFNEKIKEKLRNRLRASRHVAVRVPAFGEGQCLRLCLEYQTDMNLSTVVKANTWTLLSLFFSNFLTQTTTSSTSKVTNRGKVPFSFATVTCPG